jgi:hypothetical protein
MAELHEDVSIDTTRDRNGHNELPGFGALSPLERTQFAVREAAADLYKLRTCFTEAGVPQVPLSRLEAAVANPPQALPAVRSAIQETHIEIMAGLLAADFRLGKAYLLGRGLAYTTLYPEDKASLEDAFGPRVIEIKAWLADLSSSLPDHTSRSVLMSLRAWEAWAYKPKLDGEPLNFAKQWPGVRTALRRQGKLWRALLSGEKDAHDMLQSTDYLRAARGLMGQVIRTVPRLLVPLIVPLLLATLLVGGGIALIVLSPQGFKVLGAFAAAAGALGITGAGIRARMGAAAQELERGFWGAELDAAVAEAITVGPHGSGLKAGACEIPASGEVPRVGEYLDLVEQFRNALENNKKRAAKQLLDEEVEFSGLGNDKTGVGEVLTWVFAPRQRQLIAAHPDSVLGGRPGFLISKVGVATDVWRLRERRIAQWQRFDDYEEARVFAGLKQQLPISEAEASTGGEL